MVSEDVKRSFVKFCTGISYIHLTLAPSGPPRSFRVVAISSSSIRLTWMAPLVEEQNGVITSYEVTITDDESGEVLQRTTSAAESLLVVDSLRPYHTYQCAIAAFTVAVGPQSYAEVTTFQEGKKCAIIPPKTITISSHCLQFSTKWQPSKCYGGCATFEQSAV